MAYDAASSPSHRTSFSDQHLAPVSAHPSFNTTATPAKPQSAYPDIRGHLDSAAKQLRTKGGDLTLEELDDARRKTGQIDRLILNNKAELLLGSMVDRISALRLPEAPQFGHSFVKAMDTVQCKIEVDEKLVGPAIYVSYSYAAHEFGFVNKIGLNPDRVEDEDDFTFSTSHEFFHAFQKHVSPALKLSPFNPDTRTIVHPLDWIMLEAACERDAYTKQAMISALLAEDNPDHAVKSRNQIVTAHEFNHAFERADSLADAVVSVALKSLHKPVSRSQPHGRTFVHNYQDVALKNFAAGMTMRENAGEKGFTFVRLELQDLWQVGNYGVGPNSFGEHVMEPLVGTRHPLLPDAQEKLQEMMEKHDIPHLHACPTLSDYKSGAYEFSQRRQSAPPPAAPPRLVFAGA